MYTLIRTSSTCTNTTARPPLPAASAFMGIAGVTASVEADHADITGK